MVKRHVPVSRRIAANGGRLIGLGVWLGAVLACAVMYPLRIITDGGRAMAVIRETPVRTPESGRIAEVLVSAGQRVKSGDALAVIEVPGLAQRIAGAEARLAALRAGAELDLVDNARKFAKDADASRARWLSAQVDLEGARARLNAADLELTRLSAPGIEVPRGQIEQLQALRSAAQKEIEARQAEVNGLRVATSSAESRANATPMSALEAQLMEATAELEGLNAREAALRLTAPTDGVVGSELRALGEWAVAGDVVGLVHTSVTDEAVIYVAAATARGLTPGEEASLVGDGGEALSATVHRIGGVVEPVPARLLADPMTPAWGVPVTLKVTDRPLVPGEALAVSF